MKAAYLLPLKKNYFFLLTNRKEVCSCRIMGYVSSDHIGVSKMERELSQLSNHNPHPFNQSKSKFFKAVMAVIFCQPHPIVLSCHPISTRPEIIAPLSLHSRFLHGGRISEDTEPPFRDKLSPSCWK